MFTSRDKMFADEPVLSEADEKTIDILENRIRAIENHDVEVYRVDQEFIRGSQASRPYGEIPPKHGEILELTLMDK